MADIPLKSEAAKREEAILAFWEREQIFKKSLEKESPKGEYVFYDGPPFATGTPHYGHIVASVIKMLFRVIKPCVGITCLVSGAGIVTACRLKISLRKNLASSIRRTSR